MTRHLLLLLAVAPCFASIAFDNSADAGQATFPATQSFSITTGCANAVVLVHVSTSSQTGNPTATIGGSSATSLGSYVNPADSSRVSTLLYKTGVSAGATAIVVTNPSSGAQFMASQAVSYCGSSGIDVNANGQSTAGPITIGATTTKNHDWGLVFISAFNSLATAAGTTQRVLNNSNTIRMFAGDSNADLTPIGPYSLSVNVTGSSLPFGWFVGLAPAVTAPTVSTTSATSITNASFLSGGNVTDDGAGTVTARGVCYATTSSPTTPCTSDGSGTGPFSSHITGLSATTLYHYRAFATNTAGTSYGSDLTFTTNATAAPTNVQISQVSNTQATLTFDTPNKNVCPLQVSASASLSPLVPDVDPAIYTNADQANRAGNLNTGYHWQFIIGKRDMEAGTAGVNAGRYFSRALEANMLHYYSLNCPGGVVTGTFVTKPTPLGNTFAEPFEGDLSTGGKSPYPYLDPTVRNSYYIDPQTGLRHTAVTFPSDGWVNYPNQTYSDAADMNGATWSNPTNVYMTNMATTATTGVGNLWIGVRDTTAAMTYDFITGPSYDYQSAPGANGSISYYQVTIQAQVASGSDVLQWCLSADRATCATPLTNLSITSSLAPYTLGTYYAFPNGTNGGNGADPNLFNASPVVNRWHAYTHKGTVLSDGAGNLAWASGNYFVDNWGASSIIRLSTMSTSDACAAGTTYSIATLGSGTAMSVTGGTPAMGTFFYCSSNFGVLIKRQTPDSRTVSLENAGFNITTTPGPIWFSASVIWSPSNVLLNGGYYFMVPPSEGPLALYFFNESTGQSTLIGQPKANSGGTGMDAWNYFQVPGQDQYPFDDVATQSTGHLIFYENAVDANGKQIIIKTDLSGTPAYQLGSAGSPGPALMDQGGSCTPAIGAQTSTITCHGMTAVFTNITPASLGKDIGTQFAAVPGYSSLFGTPYFAGVANGYIIYEAQGSGSKNTLAVYARINPATGLIDNTTTSYSQPNCRWCIDHSGAQMQGPSNFIAFGTDAVGVIPGSNGANGAGPWIVTSDTAVSAAPSAICPTNSIGAPTTGTACDVFTLNSIGGANPFEPYNPKPGPGESANQFLQTAQPGDTFCISATSSCSYFQSEIMVLVSKSAGLWTMWRPGNLNIANCQTNNPLNVQNAPPAQGNCWVAIAGAGVKNFFTWCTGIGTDLDSNGIYEGATQGGPTWDTTTSGSSATWYRNLYFHGGHGDQKYNQTINGVNAPGQTAEECLESIFCGIPGTDRPADGYRIRSGIAAPGILSAPLSYVNAVSTFAGAQGNDNTGFGGAGSSHLGVGGLATAFTDDRPFQGDNLALTWTLVGGTTHTYLAGSTITLNRKQLQTAAVAGPHVLKDISGPTTGTVISDSTDMSYCVVLLVNECRTGSTIGQVYVSASQRTYLGCYSGQSIINVFAPGGNVQQDICVFPAGNNVNSTLQMGFQSDLVGWRYSMPLSFLSNGKNKMIDSFSNIRVTADSNYYIGNEQFGTFYGTQVTAVKMPLATPLQDSVLRSDFVPVTLSIKSVSGANGLFVDWGYTENGSDGSTLFYCTSRQENCVANQGSINSAAPFSYPSESPTPLACTGGTCTVTIPALPAHALYYRIRRTSSGSTVATSGVMTAVVP